MNVTTTPPPTVHIRRSWLLGLLLAVAALAAVVTWALSTYAFNSGGEAVPNVAAAAEPCGTVAPTTMPSPACRRLLERIFLGAPANEPCGTVAPTAMPSPACRRLLERIYLTGGPQPVHRR